MQEAINKAVRVMKKFEAKGTPIYFKVFDANDNCVTVVDKDISQGVREFQKVIKEIPGFSRIELFKNLTPTSKPMYTAEASNQIEQDITNGPTSVNGFGELGEKMGYTFQGMIQKETNFNMAQLELNMLRKQLADQERKLDRLEEENERLTKERREFDLKLYDKDLELRKVERNSTLGAILVEGVSNFATRKFGITPEALGEMFSGTQGDNPNVEVEIEQGPGEAIIDWVKNVQKQAPEQAESILQKLYGVILGITDDLTQLDTIVQMINIPNTSENDN